MRAVLVTAILVGLGFSGLANAQAQKVAALESAPATSATVLKRNNVEVLAGTGEGRATLTIGNDFKSGPTSWSLSFSSPVNKDGSPSEFANLDGLSNSVRSTLGISWFFGEPTEPDDSQLESLRKAEDDLCLRVAELLDKTGSELTRFTTGRCADNDPEGRGIFDLTDVERQKVKSDKELQKELRDLERKYDCITWDARNTSSCNKFFSIITLGGTVGTESFDFFDTDELEKAETRKTVWSAELSASFLHIPSAWLYRVAYRREEAFKAADTQLFCNEAQPDEPLVCQQLPGAPPSANDKDIVSVEARRNWGVAGIAPKVSFDLESDVTGVELPVFLARNDDDQLTGGLVFGWRDDQQDLTIGVFVGAPFNLF